MPPSKHALLSASSSKRWINCPPSARLCERVKEHQSSFAKQGTDAHELCEYKLKVALGMKAEDPTEKLEYYDEETEECTNDASVLSWLKSRTVPKNRGYVESSLASMNLADNDLIGIINACRVLSLNDSYWVVEEGYDGKFDDYNLYDHKLLTALSLIAYTGYGSVKAKGFTSSPEFTTNGMPRKGWRRLDDKIYLYKGGTEGFANSGNEPYSEYYAAQLAIAMGLNHIDYTLASWKKSVCSVCETFTSKEVRYVPI